MANNKLLTCRNILSQTKRDDNGRYGSHCSRFHPNRFTFGGVIAKRV